MPRPLVIFDCDGVLVDTEQRANDRMATYFTGLGFPISAHECRARFLGMAAIDVCDIVFTECGLRIDSETLRAEVLKSLQSGIAAINGAVDLVRALQTHHYDICVASSGRLKKMRTTLGQTALLPLLENVLYSAESVPRGKPHPDVFLHAADMMDYSCTNAVVIEDSVPGVQAGIAAGARVLGYCGDPFADVAKLGAAGAETFDRMDQVLALIEARV